MAYEVIQIDNDTWRIEDENRVRFFLLKGTQKALLIDAGMQVTNAREIAEKLTSLPIELIITHADPDHIRSHGEFEWFYMHPSEASNFYNSQKQSGTFVPVEDGQMLDLGERPLRIIALPGHTPGSIAILDYSRRVLISGDPIQDGTIFMFGVQREIHAYLTSLKKLDAYRDEFDTIYPSHGTLPVSPEQIDRLYEVVNDILAGKFVPEEIELWGTKVCRYETEVAAFLMDKR